MAERELTIEAHGKKHGLFNKHSDRLEHGASQNRGHSFNLLLVHCRVPAVLTEWRQVSSFCHRRVVSTHVSSLFAETFGLGVQDVWNIGLRDCVGSHDESH